MKRKILAVFVVLCLMAAFSPPVSYAAVSPYFVAINDTLLPFNENTMPLISGGEVFVPDRIFEGLGVWSVSSEDRELVRLYRGVNSYVDFYTARGVTEDQDGNSLNWPSARRVGRRFYVPLRQVCDFFGLTYQILEVPRHIVSEEQMWVVRIISTAVFNGPTFVGMNERTLRTSYNDFLFPQPAVIEPPTPQQDELSPDYSDVTIHVSFFDISAGSAESILDLLDIQASGFQSCFFVSTDDIAENPELIRRISGSGHAIGIWLTEGSLEEYLQASAMLFEAAKVRTVFVSTDTATETSLAMASEHGLQFWGTPQSFVNYDTQTYSAITAMIPRESGARKNLMLSCSEEAASIVPGLYSFLSENEFTVARITETFEPINQGW